MARALGSRFRRSPFMGLAFFGLLLALPATVGARSYSLDRVFVDARVDPDGSLWIDETLYCPRVLGQWFDGIRFYAAASSPRRSRRTWAGLR